MAEQQSIVACPTCGSFWAEGSAPKCTDPQHDHQQFSTHRHRDPVAVADGVTVVAVSYDPTDPYARTAEPDFGLYLDPRWQPPWPHDHLDWPDFGVPTDRREVLAALESVLVRARSGEQVEIGCLGGHGRTGTALACLAVLTGGSATDAIELVRNSYCQKAIETPDQERFVAEWADDHDR